MTQELTPAQEALLTAAAATEDGAVEATTAHRVTVAAVIRNGWMISIPKDGGESRLMITAAGRAIVCAEMPPAMESVTTPPIDDRTETTAQPPAPMRAAPKGKIATLVELLRAEGGATIDAMMDATGWQAHSVRGAISGSIKKGLGLRVESEKTAAGRVYRIPAITGAGA